MTDASRRRLILGTSAIAIVAALGIGAISPNADGTVAPNAKDYLRLIAREFGPQIAAVDDAKLFAQEAAERSTGPIPEATLIFAFIRATNVVRALETGEALVYLSLDRPRDAPCQNTLSVFWL